MVLSVALSNKTRLTSKFSTEKMKPFLAKKSEISSLKHMPYVLLSFYCLYLKVVMSLIEQPKINNYFL